MTQVSISQWSRNANNSADLPVDCSAYLLLTARTDFVGLNATWQQCVPAQINAAVQGVVPLSQAGLKLMVLQAVQSIKSIFSVCNKVVARLSGRLWLGREGDPGY